MKRFYFFTFLPFYLFTLLFLGCQNQPKLKIIARHSGSTSPIPPTCAISFWRTTRWRYSSTTTSRYRSWNSGFSRATTSSAHPASNSWAWVPNSSRPATTTASTPVAELLEAGDDYSLHTGQDGDFEYYAKVIDDSTRIVTIILRYLPDRAGAAEGLKEYVRNYTLH